MNTANDFDIKSMNKEQLRAACREARISYSKLNNDGMRQALVAHFEKQNAIADGEATADENTSDTSTPAANPFGALLGQQVKVAPVAGSTKVVDGKRVDEATAAERAAETRSRSSRATGPTYPRANRKGYKIEKEREERNGVKRPSKGTTCGAVWDAFDALQAATGAVTAAELPKLADDNGWNRTNVSCEYYMWRKFNGIKGRVTKAAQ